MTETGVICVTPQIPPSERLKLTKEKAIFGIFTRKTKFLKFLNPVKG